MGYSAMESTGTLPEIVIIAELLVGPNGLGNAVVFSFDFHFNLF